jgi:hypothetical protein
MYSLLIEKKEKRLHKEQVRFNKLIREIELLRTQIETTENNLRIAKLIYDVVLKPLTGKWVALKLKRLCLLNELYTSGQDQEPDTQQIKYLIIEEATELADKYHQKEAQQIFDKYSFISFEQMRYQSTVDLLQRTKVLLQELTVDENNNLKTNESESNSELQTPGSDPDPVLQQRLSLLKRMYTNLLRTFHPDKNNQAYNTSETENITKKANEAYQKKSFYELLQLEIMYINKDENYLKQLPKEELKLYNEGLKSEIESLSHLLTSVKNKYGYFFYQKFGFSGNKLKTIIQNEKLALSYRLQQMEYNWSLCCDRDKMKKYLIEHNYTLGE